MTSVSAWAGNGLLLLALALLRCSEPAQSSPQSSHVPAEWREGRGAGLGFALARGLGLGGGVWAGGCGGRRREFLSLRAKAPPRRAAGASLIRAQWYDNEEDDEDDDAPTWGKRWLFLRRPREGYDSRKKVRSRVPKDPERTVCPCGSGKSYQNCCNRFHDTGDSPNDPVELIRARYSAYAFRLPGYIIRTTQRDSPEWVKDQVKWEKELLNFCDGYKFKRLSGDVLGIEFQECTFSGPDVAYVQFRAFMLGPGQKSVEILERSKLTRTGSKWFYFKGNLLEWDGPLA